jgi:hypothetical protein
MTRVNKMYCSGLLRKSAHWTRINLMPSSTCYSEWSGSLDKSEGSVTVP